jgi:hypothetical protein
MNDGLKGMWREAVKKHYTSSCLENLWEIIKNLSQDSWLAITILMRPNEAQYTVWFHIF